MTTQTASPVNSVRRSRKQKNYDISGYKRDPTLTALGPRIAHFLNWAATHSPLTPFEDVIISQAIQDLPRTPRRTSQQVLDVKNNMQNAKKVLLRDYDRILVSEQPFGYRATFDSQDTTTTALATASIRAVRAHKWVANVVGVIDPNGFPNTPTGLAAKKQFFITASINKAQLRSTNQLLGPAVVEKMQQDAEARAERLKNKATANNGTQG